MRERLNIFLKQIEHSSYSQKYQRWEQYLKTQAQSEHYLLFLGVFLESFPFNFKYWMEYIELTKFEEYETALKRNPKSYQLWIAYLQACKQMSQDQTEYKKQLQKAIIQIGADSRSLFLYEQYYSMLTESVRYEFYKKVFTRALIGLENLYAQFAGWFDNLPEDQIKTLAIKEYKQAAANLSIQQQRQNLKQQINSIYNKTVSYRDRRIKLQDEIKHTYFNGSFQNQNQKSVWRQLIQWQRKNGIVQNISYCYQRCLMAQTDDIDLWQQVFHYMENETNKYTKVLEILRNNKNFFMNFQLDLYFYWCDLEERENINKARKMYQQLTKSNNSFEVYQRWIQFQIREKQWANAKTLYDALIGIYQNDIQVLSYILVKYAEFAVKYYKDLEYAKKLLKTYIDHLPFNQYLFTKYLEFMKNFQNNQGYYQEMMGQIQAALAKAHKTESPANIQNFIKMLKYYLRSSLNSIYLIKLSEHRILEAQERLIKQQQ